jgi:hypothetical protein
VPDAAASSMIEVEFAGGARMRIEGAADLATVSAIIKTLARDTPVHNLSGICGTGVLPPAFSPDVRRSQWVGCFKSRCC